MPKKPEIFSVMESTPPLSDVAFVRRCIEEKEKRAKKKNKIKNKCGKDSPKKRGKNPPRCSKSSSSATDAFNSCREVNRHHGFLFQQDINRIQERTKFSTADIYRLFIRFKALCSMSSTARGIDKETFKKGAPMLSVEDDLFVDRVFAILDSDASDHIEWEEFVEAISALEINSSKRVELLFKCYDEDNDGSVSRDELHKFFLSSLMVKVDDDINETASLMIREVFDAIDTKGTGSLTVEDALEYFNEDPENRDVYQMLGRSIVSGS